MRENGKPMTRRPTSNDAPKFWRSLSMAQFAFAPPRWKDAPCIAPPRRIALRRGFGRPAVPPPPTARTRPSLRRPAKLAAADPLQLGVGRAAIKRPAPASIIRIDGAPARHPRDIGAVAGRDLDGRRGVGWPPHASILAALPTKTAPEACWRPRLPRPGQSAAITSDHAVALSTLQITGHSRASIAEMIGFSPLSLTTGAHRRVTWVTPDHGFGRQRNAPPH